MPNDMSESNNKKASKEAGNKAQEEGKLTPEQWANFNRQFGKSSPLQHITPPSMPYTRPFSQGGRANRDKIDPKAKLDITASHADDDD
ncbi:hypothetical protein SJAG_04344 [Schizosaccharomyces japonicus yFS275]|uniref:Uncharacterized protein n=1 Tax=Schizosaccharomyces japonicus (strain yFS275 / FY16936) TaxID=402676 RepID=B6K6K9_SCHJY|nr:hypothetical protein SJAG_04344 [Schizosaccharomyces japonicus yFS275]EEB09163.2 hypothetical protein SJAG_04344 [Schizosaccharomyces japonicus yFS275]